MIENAYIAYPLAILAGFLGMMMVVGTIQAIGHKVSPPPENIDFQDPEALRKYVTQASAMQLAWVPLAYLAGPFAGTLLASWIVQNHYDLLAFLYGLPMLVMAIQMVKRYPGPAWFNFLAIVAIPTGVTAAVLLATRIFATG